MHLGHLAFTVASLPHLTSLPILFSDPPAEGASQLDAVVAA
jgi:hypothetical protein